MSALSRVRLDEFTIAMLATVMLAFLLPCRGTSAGIFGGLAAVAIASLRSCVSKPSVNHLKRLLDGRQHFVQQEVFPSTHSATARSIHSC
jgi:predicted Na+-dependent transporter